MKFSDKEFDGPYPFASPDLPSVSAVYCITSGDAVLYVGIARNLKMRISQHHRNPAFEVTDLEPQVFFWKFDESKTLEAHALEATLISSIRPKLNRVIPNREALQVRELDKQAQKASRFATLVAGVASSAAIAITVSQLFGVVSDRQPEGSLEAKVAAIEARLADQNQAINKIAATTQSLQKAIVTSGARPTVSADAEALKTLSEGVKENSSKISALEAALNTDPSKALAVPLLRKDLDNARDSLKANIDQTKSEIDRIYDQNKWFIGLMFTIALSVLSMAASNFFSRRAPESTSIE